jgi:hypothetical protein
MNELIEDIFGIAFALHMLSRAIEWVNYISAFQPVHRANWGANNLPYFMSPRSTLQVIITLSLT